MLKRFLMISLLSYYFCNAADSPIPSEENDQPVPLAEYDMVTMPDQSTLASLFAKAELDDFVEKTNVVARLAGTTLHAAGIEMAERLMLQEYSEVLAANPSSQSLSKTVKDQITKRLNAVIDTIVKDYPKIKKKLDQFRAKFKEQQQ
jgi:hypothetical protein